MDEERTSCSCVPCPFCSTSLSCVLSHLPRVCFFSLSYSPATTVFLSRPFVRQLLYLLARRIAQNDVAQRRKKKTGTRATGVDFNWSPLTEWKESAGEGREKNLDQWFGLVYCGVLYRRVLYCSFFVLLFALFCVFLIILIPLCVVPPCVSLFLCRAPSLSFYFLSFFFFFGCCFSFCCCC